MATDDFDTGTSGDALQPGTTLSDTYAIERHLATGGMAEVYRARNIHTDEPVAIKVVLPAFAKDETILALFKKEATVLSRLHHDAIVHYHLFTVEKDMKRPYLVMEFVDGTALSDHLKRAPLDAQSTRTLISRVASGLAAAHSLGVIHRDLSPDNVILPDDDVSKTKIIDFGIAKAAAVGKGTLLGDKFAGKYNYVSPEQLGLAGGEITPRSDMYSLGLIAAAALLGQPIDMTGSGSHVDVIDRRREVPDLSNIDPSLRPVLTAMLQPKPQDRPADMKAVIDILSGAIPLPAGPGAPGTGTVFGAEMPAYPPAQTSQPPASDPWKDPTRIRPSQQSQPPADYFRSQPPGYPQDAQQGSYPPPPQSVPPGYGSMPPSSFGPGPGHSIPPGYGNPGQVSMPPGQVSMPPTSPPPGAGSAFSESPFGPYVESGEPKFKLPPPPPAPEKGRRGKRKSSGGSPVGLIVGAAAVVIIGGVGALGFTQGWFGGGTPVVTPTTQPQTTTVTPTVAEPATTATPTIAQPATTVVPTPSVRPQTTVTPSVAQPATTVTPAVTPTVTPSTTVTPTATGPAQQILSASAIVDWVDKYPFKDCEFAATTQVADGATTIEAFGTKAAPFEVLASDFEKAQGFAPQINVRLLNDSQCALPNFLHDLHSRSIDNGPVLSVSSDITNGKQTVSGTLTGVTGWNTYVLLVDYVGSVIDLSRRVTRSGNADTFNFTATLQDTQLRPMTIVAVASRAPLEHATFKTNQSSKVIFPVIRRDIEASDEAVSVTARYFKLGQTSDAAAN